MTKKNIFFIVLIFLLIAFFFYLNRDWFVSEKVQILHRSGPPLRFARFGRQGSNKPAVIPLFFEFNRKLKLSSVKVFPVSAIETNKYPHPIWELVPIYQPVATKGLEYGVTLPGMKPRVQGAVADPLAPGVKYRLVIEAGSLTAEHDFVPEAPK